MQPFNITKTNSNIIWAVCCGIKSCITCDKDDNDKLRDEMTDEETDDGYHAIGNAHSHFQLRLATL